jgi:hypothetical protein
VADVLPTKQERLYGKIKGTVTSGHPTKTTLGNSLRVFLLNAFICT